MMTLRNFVALAALCVLATLPACSDAPTVARPAAPTMSTDTLKPKSDTTNTTNSAQDCGTGTTGSGHRC